MITSIAAALAMGAPALGLAVEDRVSPFEPYHVSGPYKDTTMCPVCEWGLGPMVIIWTQGKSPSDLERTVRVVDRAVGAAPKGSVKAIVVDANFKGNDKESRKRMAAWAEAWKTPNVYFMCRETKAKAVLKDYKLGTAKGWDTFLTTSKNVRVTARFLDPKESDGQKITEAIQNLVAK